jgi:CRISPR-associated protein Cas7/Cst2/DevR subtype I-B
MNQAATRAPRPFVCGIVMTDEWAASPNMGDTEGEGASKTAKMKAVKTSEGIKTILSGQAVGSWHRQTLYDRFGWKISELQETISGRDTRQFYTQCQPIEFAEDDGRGYMAAVTWQEAKTKIPLTTKRTSPFMLSQFQSLAPNARMRDYGILARNLDELPEEVKGALIFRTEIAAAAYGGLFSLNVSELGRFTIGVGRDLLPLSEFKRVLPASYKAAANKAADARNAEEKIKVSELEKALKRCVDHERGTVLLLPATARQQRAHDLIAAMAELEGGAHQTRRLYNVAPAAALVAFMDGGNCLPPHIFTAAVRSEDEYGNRLYRFEVSIERLWKVLKDNVGRLLDGSNGKCLFYGSLGAPAVSNEAQVRAFLTDALQGEEKEKYPLPEGLKDRIAFCDGPREAIHAAADSLPPNWFSSDGATEISAELRYGQQLLKDVIS